MSKRSIPVLITLMSIALLGIIYIQYKWIDTSINEKQKLIDNNVILAVANVEEQMNDYRAMTFISNSEIQDFSFNSLSGFQEADSVTIWDNKTDSAQSLEIKVITSFQSDSETNKYSDSLLHDHSVLFQESGNQFIHIMDDSINTTYLNNEWDHLESLINKIKIEVETTDYDTRLDSNKFADLLKSELAANDLGNNYKWGIFDTKENKFIIVPKGIAQSDYEIPLFTTDFAEPGRFNLHLTLEKGDLIRKGIWFMIGLSLLFILIISVVFAYSIKLIIKHKRISQIKSDFMNNMTHEFKTPLATISLAADSLLHPNTDLTKENLSKYISIIQDEKTKLNFQIERILELASLNKNTFNIPLTQMDVNTSITTALSALKLRIEKEKVTVSLDLTEPTNVIANQAHLQNALVNLIENGIKYSESAPKIHISSQLEKDLIVIKIKDEGIGMSSAQLKKAFQDFYRVQSGNLHTTKGFGLGLSYTKLIIEKMGGTVTLESKIKEGTTAIIKLKLA